MMMMMWFCLFLRNVCRHTACLPSEREEILKIEERWEREEVNDVDERWEREHIGDKGPTPSCPTSFPKMAKC